MNVVLVSLALVILAGTAQAAGTSIGATGTPLEPRQVFALLFLMLGPIKILAPFVRMTQGCDAAFRGRLATRAILYSMAALTLAAAMGRHVLENFSVPVSVLSLTGGIVLFLVALQTVLQQFRDQPSADPPAPSLAMAFSPLAFPTVVTPYGIAAVIIFMTLAEGDGTAQAVIAGEVAAILALDWLAMMFAHVLLRWFGTVLQIFAVVLGVTQVAIGLHVILRALSAIGVFEMRV